MSFQRLSEIFEVTICAGPPTEGAQRLTGSRMINYDKSSNSLERSQPARRSPRNRDPNLFKTFICEILAAVSDLLVNVERPAACVRYDRHRGASGIEANVCTSPLNLRRTTGGTNPEMVFVHSYRHTLQRHMHGKVVRSVDVDVGANW